jgi:hypothetical protein
VHESLVLRAAGAAALMTAIGCTHVSPRIVVRDRFDYGQSVAESWKRQMLLNVVRVRYADAPVFMDVTSVILSYTVLENANAAATLFSSASPNEVTLGASGSFANTPTITYQPLTGDKFMKNMLRPIPPSGVFQLLQAGWSAEMLLRISVGTINGLRNSFRGSAADPRFDQLIAAVSRLQRAGGLNIRIEQQKDGEAAIMALPIPPGAGTMSADRAEIQRLLGLEPGATEYSLTFGLTPRSPTEVAVQTRSMIEIMVEFGVGIDVPDADRTEGRVLPTLVAGGAPASQLVHVLSGPSAPANAYAAIPYRGRWYWVADTDLVSKLRFTLLMILSSLAESGATPITPVITVPSR